MSSFLIARLLSQPKSLGAVEYMQRNAFSYHISSNVPLLNLLMSPGGVEGHLETVIRQSEKVELGKEERHIIGQMTSIFDVKKEVKEEVDDAVQPTNSIENPSDQSSSIEIKRIVEEYEEKLKIVQKEKEKELEELKRRIEDLEKELEKRKRDVNDVLIARDEVEKNLEEAQEQLTEKISIPQETLSAAARPTESEEVLHESAMEPVHDEDLLESDASVLSQVPDEQCSIADAAVDADSPGEVDIINLSMESGITEPFDQNGEVIVDNMEDTLLMPAQGDDFPDSFDFDESSIREEVSEAQELENDSGDEEEVDEEEMELEKESEDEKDSDEEEKSEEDDEENVRNDRKQNVHKKMGRPRGKSAVYRLLFACPMEDCSSSFNTFEELKKHAKSHSGKEKSSCDVCKKDFSSVRQAMEHIQKREEKTCCACEKRFSQNWFLLLHHRVHTKETPYECDVCGKRSSIESNFNKHMITHSAVKPFSCSICKKQFAQKGHLENHTRVHTGEKPFKCSQCGKRFADVSNLKAHERMHSGEKRFECDQCGRKFDHKGHMKSHMRLHTGEKPFACKKCGAKFAHKFSFIYHMKRKHPQTIS